MNRANEMAFWFILCVFTLTSSAVDAVTSQAPFVTAYMDKQQRDQGYGCGDTIEDTVSGEISSVIPAYTPGFNCTLTLVSPPGTRLSLTVTGLNLVPFNPSTCGGTRLKILGEANENSPSLLSSFPNGLCGYTEPSQAVHSPANTVHLLLETRQMTLESTFSMNYTAFKNTQDDYCFDCDVGGSSNSPFCIDPRLVCDDRQNCPENTEETTANCMASTPPSASGSIVITVVVWVLALVLLAIIIFVILIVVAKRARSKRNRGRAGSADRSGRDGPSQRGGGPPPGLIVDVERRQRYAGDVPERFALAPYQPPLLPSHPLGPPPAFTVNGEYQEGSRPVPGQFPGAPPAYSTLPRPMEQSLQMAENTNPASRSRIGSTDDEIEPRTP